MSTKKKWTTEEVELLRENSIKGKDYISSLFPDRTWKSIRHKIVNSGFEIANSYDRYTKEEDDILREHSEQSQEYLLGLLPNRKWDSITYRIEVLKLPRNKGWELWTTEEEDIVRLYETMDEMKEHLPNRTECMIQQKANKMGIIFSNPWTKNEEDILVESYSRFPADEVAKAIGRSLQSIYLKANKMGLRSYYFRQKFEVEDVISLYEDGMLIKDIASLFSVNADSISKVIPKDIRRDVFEFDISKAVEMYQEGVGFPTISREMNTSEYAIKTTLKKEGVAIKKSSDYFESYRLPLPIEEISDLYLYGFSSVELGETYETNGSTIIQRLRESDIPIRSDSGYYSIRKSEYKRLSGEELDFNSLARNRKEYFKWRSDVFERDCYTCQCCGDSTGGKLNAHHIQNFSSYENLRYDASNGISMCVACHLPNIYGSFHNTYGTHNNDIYQLQEYFDDIRSHLGLPLITIESIVNPSIAS